MLTHDELRRVLHYEPASGEFTWLVSLNSRTRRGKKAGCPAKNGRYWRIGFRGHIYPAHRLAWFWMTGEWPAKEIDHKDNDGLNNRWANLREADRYQNMANRGAHADSSIGLKGVYLHRQGKFIARLQVKNKRVHLGMFETPEAAHEAYARAAKETLGEFSRA
jgi:hypothetical protein